MGFAKNGTDNHRLCITHIFQLTQTKSTQGNKLIDNKK